MSVNEGSIVSLGVNSSRDSSVVKKSKNRCKEVSGGEGRPALLASLDTGPVPLCSVLTSGGVISSGGFDGTN